MLPNIQTLAVENEIIDLPESFKGYNTITIVETYGLFYFIEKGNEAKLLLEGNKSYDLKKIIQIGNFKDERRKSLPTFNYILSNR